MNANFFSLGNFSWMKSTRSATSLVSGTGDRNTHLLPWVVIRWAVPAMTICATSDWRLTWEAARLAGLLMLPIVISTSSREIRRLTMLTACSGLPASSP